MTENTDNVDHLLDAHNPLTEIIKRCETIISIAKDFCDPALHAAYTIVDLCSEICEDTSKCCKNLPTLELENKCTSCITTLAPLVEVAEAIAAELCSTAVGIPNLTDPNAVVRALQSACELLESRSTFFEDTISRNDALKAYLASVSVALETALKVYGAFNGVIASDLFRVEKVLVNDTRVFRKVFQWEPRDAVAPQVREILGTPLLILKGSVSALVLSMIGLMVLALYIRVPRTGAIKDEKYTREFAWAIAAFSMTLLVGGLTGLGFMVWTALRPHRLTTAVNDGTP